MKKQFNFLTKRLINQPSPNYSSRNRETLFDYYRKNQMEAYNLLDKNVVLEDDVCIVKEAVMDFHFEDFLRFKNIKIGKLIAWRDGMVFELK